MGIFPIHRWQLHRQKLGLLLFSSGGDFLLIPKSLRVSIGCYFSAPQIWWFRVGVNHIYHLSKSLVEYLRNMGKIHFFSYISSRKRKWLWRFYIWNIMAVGFVFFLGSAMEETRQVNPIIRSFSRYLTADWCALLSSTVDRRPAVVE